MAKVSLARIAGAKVETEPFQWVCVDETFDSSDTAWHLMKQFPNDDFQRLQSRNDGKHYSFSGRRVTSDSIGLTHGWREFIGSLEAPAYRQTLSSLLRLDLEKLPPDITLWRYHEGDYLSPHTDKMDKVVSHIFYFSERDWSIAHGGCLDILRDEPEPRVVRRVEPVCGRSVIIVRSDRSLHAVTTQKRTGYARCAAQVVFHRQTLSYSHNLAT